MVIEDITAVWFVLVDNVTSGNVASITAPLGDIHVMLTISEPVTPNVKDALSPLSTVAFSGSVEIASGTTLQQKFDLLIK